MEMYRIVMKHLKPMSFQMQKINIALGHHAEAGNHGSSAKISMLICGCSETKKRFIMREKWTPRDGGRTKPNIAQIFRCGSPIYI